MPKYLHMYHQAEGMTEGVGLISHNQAKTIHGSKNICWYLWQVQRWEHKRRRIDLTKYADKKAFVKACKKFYKD
jgi:hypothetical protein